jgi:dihydroneopterin aldolase
LLTIHLNNLLFHAHHGLYEEEIVLGNDFEVNITIHQNEVAEKITSLHQTIDYSKVYEMVKLRMQQPTPLLETLAQEVCDNILTEFSLVEKVLFSIKKLNPPIAQFQGSVGISFEREKGQ